MKDLKKEFIEEVQAFAEKNQLKDYDAFLFFMIKMIWDYPDDVITEAITNKSKDFGIDAIIIDKNHKVIRVIQSKYSEKIGESPFNKDELNKLNFAYNYLIGKEIDTKINEYLNKIIKDRLNKSIRLIKEEDYEPCLYFFTTHKENVNYKIYDNSMSPVHIRSWREVERLYESWKVNATPELGEIRLNYLSMVKAPFLDPIAYIFNINVKELKKIYSEFEERLFSRNVRIFYKDKPKANRNMKNTLLQEPNNFWYFNNGITILSEEVKLVGDNKIILRNPQIINGCQTVSTIGITEKLSGDAFIFAKVVQIADKLANQKLIDGIIEANNRQTPVDERMLKSNHPLQVYLQRQLMDQGFYYERKEGDYKDSKSNIIRKLKRIKNIDLVKANITLPKGPHSPHTYTENDLFSTYFSEVFKEGKSYLDYLIPYLIWDKIVFIGKRCGGKNRYTFNKFASFCVLRLIYDNCEDLNNNSKIQWILYKLINKEPYQKFKLNEKSIKQLFTIIFDKFNRSDYKEKASGQRDFFKSQDTFRLIDKATPKYLKKDLNKLFEYSI